MYGPLLRPPPMVLCSCAPRPLLLCTPSAPFPHSPSYSICFSHLASLCVCCGQAVQELPQGSYTQLLEYMRKTLASKGLRQVPELSASRALPLDAQFDLGPGPGGQSKALLIGIDYRGHPGALRGCVNDALNVRTWLMDNGVPGDAAHMRVLVDDGEDGHIMPTRQCILEAIQWLVTDVKEGDSLFFHYSGHGAQVPSLLFVLLTWSTGGVGWG